MKKIIFYTRVADVLLYTTLSFLLICLILAVSILYMDIDKISTLLCLMGILFLPTLITGGLSFKYLSKKEQALCQRYNTDSKKEAYRKFEVELENL
jgi:hypothetical protein